MEGFFLRADYYKIVYSVALTKKAWPKAWKTWISWIFQAFQACGT